MYLIGRAHGLAIESWRIMFLVFGSATIVVSVAFTLFMPRDTATAWLLKCDDGWIAAERLAVDRETRVRSQFDWVQVREAFIDPHTYLLFCMGLYIYITSPTLKFSVTKSACKILLELTVFALLIANHIWLRPQ
jgi:hypothetical protein